MAFYSVCSLIIESDLLPKKYHPFFISDNNAYEHVDMIIRKVSYSHKRTQLRKVLQLSHMTVWREVSDRNSKWVYEILNGMGTISVDEEYSEVEIFCNDFDGYLDPESLREICSPYIQIIIECKLIQNGYVILHSACIEKDGNAYAFTGPSGVGKSSRAEKWCELLTANWISGDRPAINACNGTVHGVPWDGKEAVYRNYHCPLKAILKVNRSEDTSIKDMEDKEKIQLLCEQTSIPLWDPVVAAKAMYLIKILIKQVPIYNVYCDITDESTVKTYQIINNKTGL